MKNYLSDKSGFTLIEMLIAIGLLAVLATIAIIAINPAQQFADARDTQRRSDVKAILDAIDQNIIDNRGAWTCAAGPIPASARVISSTDYDICDCVVPDHLAALPGDPSINNTYYTDCNLAYDTGYTLELVGSRVKVSAPQAEGEIIGVTR